MHLIDATNAEAYLRDAGRIGKDERVVVRELAGGVSNIVLLVEFLDNARAPFVLKQAREQLRVAQPWFCSPERIWREVEVLKVCARILSGDRRDRFPNRVPTLLFEDRAHYLFAMSAAPANAVTWKSCLLAGQAESKFARACGYFLGHLHAESWRSMKGHEALRDQRFFIDLRLDPYYRHVAERHASIRAPIEHLIDDTLATQTALVHGDFSPKNLLVSQDEVLLIDFEVGHLGDPAFDVGFFLTHLCLKAIHLPHVVDLRELPHVFWQHYYVRLKTAQHHDLLNEPRCVQHLLACLLARVDGKSPVDYLTPDEQTRVRALCLESIPQPPITMTDALQQILAVRTP